MTLTPENIATLETTDRDTVIRFGPMWVQHSLINLPVILRAPFLNQTMRDFAGLPAIIVAPGPSLSKNVHLLKEFKHRALIVCTTHVVKTLRDAGCEPDLVTVLDPQDISYHVSELEKPLSTFLLATSAHPKLFQAPSDRRIVFTPNGPYDEWFSNIFGESHSTVGGISVSIMSANVLRAWGCSPIVFVGQDLAFTTDGKWYAEGSADEEAQILYRPDNTAVWNHSKGAIATAVRQGMPEISPPEKTLFVPGYYGGEVPTCWAYKMTGAMLSMFAKDTPGTVNATEGGAYLEHMEHVPLSEVLSRVPIGSAPRADGVFSNEVGKIHLPSRMRLVRRKLEALKAGLVEANMYSRQHKSTDDIIRALLPASLMTFVYKHGKVWRSRNAPDAETSHKLLRELVMEVHDEVSPRLGELISICRKSPDALREFTAC